VAKVLDATTGVTVEMFCTIYSNKHKTEAIETFD